MPGLYIHVPFCASKCPYCDFYSVADRGRIDNYISAVIDELATLRRVGPFAGDLKHRAIATVYFGGGTPSFLGAENLSRLLLAVKDNFTVAPGAEITAECNPSSSLVPGFFETLAAAGFNRVSLGMQSAVDAERKKLGRKATAADVETAVKACQRAGIADISLDIMLGVPEQTERSLLSSLDFALSLGVTHLSAYMLSIEEGTFFDKKRDALNLPEEDAVCDMYLSLCGYLKSNGFRHYEISNFCLPGHEARHNTAYWRDEEYLGVGPAAHSYLNGRRFYFPRDLDAFIAGAPPVDDGPGGGWEEAVMLALRLDTGISLQEMQEKYGVAPSPDLPAILQEYQSAGLLTFDGDRIALTEKGFLVSNAVIGEILSVIQLD
ncbi:MAG: radical SAM family heme chaperone HemW [Clostridia bacterium]|nr:radical SAM family heme chaperone HemW [Clostridia bacterium]